MFSIPEPRAWTMISNLCHRWAIGGQACVRDAGAQIWWRARAVRRMDQSGGSEAEAMAGFIG